MAVHNEAVAEKVRRGAPLATDSINRRALRECAEAMSDENTHELICGLCARCYPRVVT